MSLIDIDLQRREENGKVRPPKTLYVTDIVKPCLRQAYFNIIIDKPYPLESLRIFEAGNILENYWISILEKSEKILARQLPAYVNLGDWAVHGRIDILTQRANEKVLIHEVKSAKKFYGSAQNEHLDQLQFYLNATGIYYGCVDYLDKTALMTGDAQIDTSIEVTKNQDDFLRITAKAGELINFLESSELPPSNSTAWKGRICDYCQFRAECSGQTRIEEVAK